MIDKTFRAGTETTVLTHSSSVTKWMKGIEKKLKKKVKSTSELKVTDKDLQDVAKKRKNWSAPGLDGITNYLWKTLTATRKPLARAMQK